jgi:hypothetical protein
VSKLEPMNLDRMLTLSDLRSTAANSYHTTMQDSYSFNDNRLSDSVCKRRTTVKKPGFILKNAAQSLQVFDYDSD